jgi:hypothetical protein
MGLFTPRSEDAKTVTATSEQDEGVTVVLPRALWAQVKDFAAEHQLHPSARKMLAVIVQYGLKVAADEKIESEKKKSSR